MPRNFLAFSLRILALGVLDPEIAKLTEDLFEPMALAKAWIVSPRSKSLDLNSFSMLEVTSSNCSSSGKLITSFHVNCLKQCCNGNTFDVISGYTK